ncbi:hypothetical protein PILCRDRAFT_603156 [Piloderma croceum F 1598]|uniref:Uncharacterized protein n=1 Tax=Piloderma croceum (strain F 1598) TaxID=765440 RepID=A0A0C3FDW7_PILCF|nr:hypothetical protein PILCRDRAFT_603156 [Piloderma croceum F 1598]
MTSMCFAFCALICAFPYLFLLLHIDVSWYISDHDANHSTVNKWGASGQRRCQAKSRLGNCFGRRANRY